LFVALVPPDDVLAEIAEEFAHYRREWTDLRWIPQEQWHVTLAFLGEVDDALLGPLEERLSRAVSRHDAMPMTFTGTGAFPSPARARVFWTGLTEDPEAAPAPRTPLRRLAGSLAAGARRAGVADQDRKRFHAHLTLARSSREADLRPLIRLTRIFAGRPWQATTVHLIRSHQGPPIRYEPLTAWPLD
jgi:2'-5' RNA ligase